MTFLRVAVTILAKDLKVELRSKEIVLTTGLFALLVVVLFAFAFGLNQVSPIAASCGALWIAVAFSGILALGRTFERERDMGVWTAIVMSPAPRSAVYLGKLLGVMVFMTVVELVLIPVIELFFHAPMLANLHTLAPIIILANIGYCSAGTLFGAMTVRTRLKDLLLGVILFPLTAPVLIFAVKASQIVLGGDGLSGASDYLKLLAVFDAVFVLGGLWFFDALMED